MARLKSTYVEGDLTVEGNLFVDAITNPNGSRFPFISTEDTKTLPNRIVKFDEGEDGSNAGGMTASSVRVTEKSEHPADRKTPETFSIIESVSSIEVDGTGNEKAIGTIVKIPNQNLYAVTNDKSKLKLNRNTDSWYFEFE